MKIDLYVKALLTIIAACLIALVFRSGSALTVAHAASSTTCKGELKANPWGGTEASIGGYKVELTCE